MTFDCCNPVKVKFPDAAVVVDAPASGPFTMDTVASAIGMKVRLVMTLPLSENVVGVGAAGDEGGVALLPHATAETKTINAQSPFNTRTHRISAALGSNTSSKGFEPGLKNRCARPNPGLSGH